MSARRELSSRPVLAPRPNLRASVWATFEACVLTRGAPGNSRIFYEKRMAQEVAADQLGDEFKGYVVRITGGNDVRPLTPRASLSRLPMGTRAALTASSPPRTAPSRTRTRLASVRRLRLRSRRGMDMGGYLFGEFRSRVSR